MFANTGCERLIRVGVVQTFATMPHARALALPFGESGARMRRCRSVGAALITRCTPREAALSVERQWTGASEVGASFRNAIPPGYA